MASFNADELLVSIGLNTDDLKKGGSEAIGVLGEIKSAGDLMGAGVKLAVIGVAALAAGAGALLGMATKGLDSLRTWNESINELHDRLGLTGPVASTFAVAMNHVGLSFDEGSQGLNYFTKNLDNLNQAVVGAKVSPFGVAFETLGVKAKDATGKLLPFEALMPKIMDAFQRLPDGVTKTALAMDLFGARGGTRFIQFLSQGSAGLERARTMAELYGLTLSTDLSKATEEFGFQLNDLGLAAQGAWVIIGSKVLPVASKFIDFVNAKVVPIFINFAKKVAPQVAQALGDMEKLFETVFTSGLPILESLWNILELLATGDFTGGIFGFTEDSLFIGALLTARDTIIGLFNALTKGDWSGAWKVIADGVANLGALIQDQLGDPGTFLKKWGTHFWDWLKVATDEAAGKLGAVINALTDWAQANAPAVGAALMSWGAGIWNWITTTAVPAIDTEWAKLTAGINKWIAANGPGTWSDLTAWATQIWDWLTTTAVTQAGVAFTNFVADIQSTLALNGPTAWNLVSTWGVSFWDWMTNPSTGVISQAADKLTQVSNAMLAASNTPESKQGVHDAGVNFALTFYGALGEILGGTQGQTESNNAFLKFLSAWNTATINNKAMNEAAGHDFAQGIYDGAAIYFKDTGPTLHASIVAWLDRTLKELDVDITAFAVKFDNLLINAINNGMANLHLNLPLIPNIPIPTIPQGGGLGTSGAAGAASAQGRAGAQAMNLSIPLQVNLDGKPLQEALLTKTFNSVSELFNTATASVGASGGN